MKETKGKMPSNSFYGCFTSSPRIGTQFKEVKAKINTKTDILTFTFFYGSSLLYLDLLIGRFKQLLYIKFLCK